MTQGFTHLLTNPLTVLEGGTGATIPVNARTNLGLSYATELDQIGNTSTSTIVSPGTQKFNPTSLKAYVRFDGTTSGLSRNFNVSSITDNGVGNWTLNFTIPFNDSNYCAVVNAQNVPGGPVIDWRSTGTVVDGSFGFMTWHTTNNALVDPTFCCAMFAGEF